MTGLARISGRDCVEAFERACFRFIRPESTHIVIRRDAPFAQLVVPDHKEIDRGTLRQLIWHAGMTVDQFGELL